MSQERSRSPRNDGTNLYISNLSYSTKEQELLEKFESFGKIKYCKVVRDPSSGKSRGFGFVTFEDLEQAEEAQEQLNNSTLDGREIRIEKAKRSRAYSPTPGKYLGRHRDRRDDYYRRSRSPYSRRRPRRSDSRSPRRNSRRSYSRSPPRHSRKSYSRSPRRRSPRHSPHRYH